MSTTSADISPELREKFCSRCGELTTTICPECEAQIRGYYHVEGVITLGGKYEPPPHCYNCGAAFPWTKRKMAAAIELLETDGVLTNKELAQFREDLAVLTMDSPGVQIASIRFKKAMAKVGLSVASGVREIIVDVLSEAAKKALWGSGS
ncbi:DUF2321 domain-containing protein [Rhodanobacter denitrificans]|nr:hypothetical protein RHOFW104R3_29175 [Rhodanobacter denitrificans]UJJ52003.1 DUF2321 domain-containing protein [Rhodanobacter denitrificans]UJJ59214.1 DUF2321 domain-containing protein [Rhodanobacter denitrificans]UJM94747.1 DUF2321 domain-containing protein [Rhodanobacter denitrificans]UJM98277.1 DUF2321 domain-containing protein [Rhodanobacter denitrificans]